MDGRRTGTLLACLVSLIVAVPAAAQTAPDGWVATARQLADRHWGLDPCGGDVTITWGKLPPQQNAVSTWLNPHEDYGDPANNTQCSVTFNTKQDWDWPKFCTIAIHEFGHLAGNPHSDDPDDVMFAYYAGTNAPECRASPAAARAPTAPRPGRPSPAAKRASRSKAYRAGTTRHPKRPGSRTRRR
jgi:hypothetical protein